MAINEEAHEQTFLLDPHTAELNGRRGLSRDPSTERAESMIFSAISKEEHALGATAIGERLPYNDYTTIDWLHDLVKDSFRYRALHTRRGIRARVSLAWDKCQGWVAAVMIGAFTAIVAFLVDVFEGTISDYKVGFCSTNPLQTREACCISQGPWPAVTPMPVDDACHAWKSWSQNYWGAFGVYVGFALFYGIISGSVTMTTKTTLPVAPNHDQDDNVGDDRDALVQGKTMYKGVSEVSVTSKINTTTFESNNSFNF